jgi:hypothetical protein
MSKVVLMRVFEAQPARFERDMDLLTLGAHERIHERIAESVPPHAEVCEIGCGWMHRPENETSSSITIALERHSATPGYQRANPSFDLRSRQQWI